MLAPKPGKVDPDKLPIDKMPVQRLLDVLPEGSPLFEALASGPVAMSQPLPPTDFLA